MNGLEVGGRPLMTSPILSLLLCAHLLPISTTFSISRAHSYSFNKYLLSSYNTQGHQGTIVGLEDRAVNKTKWGRLDSKQTAGHMG